MSTCDGRERAGQPRSREISRHCRQSVSCWSRDSIDGWSSTPVPRYHEPRGRQWQPLERTRTQAIAAGPRSASPRGVSRQQGRSLMVECPACGKENAPHRKRCVHCGGPLGETTGTRVVGPADDDEHTELGVGSRRTSTPRFPVDTRRRAHEGVGGGVRRGRRHCPLRHRLAEFRGRRRDSRRAARLGSERRPARDRRVLRRPLPDRPAARLRRHGRGLQGVGQRARHSRWPSR